MSILVYEIIKNIPNLFIYGLYFVFILSKHIIRYNNNFLQFFSTLLTFKFIIFLINKTFYSSKNIIINKRRKKIQMEHDALATTDAENDITRHKRL